MDAPDCCSVAGGWAGAGGCRSAGSASEDGAREYVEGHEGLWVLSPHEDARSEFALTSWGETRSSVRLDRVFFAGHKPLEAGNDSLWIIDYKTATHGREGVDEFLAEERVKYGAQMDAYARMMRDRVEAGGCAWGCTIRCCRGWSGGSRRLSCDVDD